MAEGQDWDLYAIVRSCTSAAANRNSSGNTSENFENPFESLASLTFDDDDDQEFNPFSFPNLAVQPTNNNSLQELQDSYKPFLPGYTASGLQGDHNDNIPSSSSISDFGVIFSGQNPPQLAHHQQQQNHDLLLHHRHHHQQQPQPPPPPSTSVSISPRFRSRQQQPQHVLQQQQNQRRQLHQLGTSASSIFPLTSQSQTPRSRKKKSNQKRLVLHVTAENLSNDVWAWRKYGQKPIKGSPYPRNYYRCSSSKGCAARKQVERSNTDPNMFIVSYTGDHTHPRPTHRNSLAGSTRNKVQQAVQKPEEKEPEQPSISADKGLCSSPLSATSLSPRTPLSAPIDHAETAVNDQGIKIENLKGGHGLMGSDDDDDDCNNDINDDYDDDLLIPNMALNEDFIKGFQELVSASEGGGGGSSK
ncbi:hypothetical protein SADUNF_Sadunf17G0134900 [Salix dunnii]|uniref:WRKY domain-containing protein n=1 Tax=Salix dunnii TaxID=1413687 RepID=A0A835MHU4_9ROSI|nr:hypothetical protein SADUNF_Sadunf17G0134900 [Salix dunnii]